MRQAGSMQTPGISNPPVRFIAPEDAGGPAPPPGAAEVLERINRKVAAGESLDEVMNFVYDATRALYPCDRLGLAMIEEDGRRAVARWARAEYAPLHLKPGYAEDVHGGSLEGILRTGRMRIISDLEAYLRARPGSASTRLIVAEGARSSLTCPLRVEDRIVGLLFRSARRTAAYGDEHARLHGFIAERLSQAVEKVWRLAQLEEARRGMSEMLGFISHEMKNPLNVILLHSRVLQDGLLGPMPAAQADKVGRIHRTAEHMLGLVREYLDLARLDGAGPPLRPRPDVRAATDLVAPILDRLAPAAAGNGQRVEVDIPETLTVECDPDLMGIALSNLIGNAIKYGAHGGRITVRAERDDHAWTCSIWNEGHGFRPEDRDRLFRRFSRLKDGSARGVEGTGLGLYAAWRIVRRHGGRIDATSEPGAWAEFRIIAPQPVEPETDAVRSGQ
jgi:signal transduction histidine kinase